MDPSDNVTAPSVPALRVHSGGPQPDTSSGSAHLYILIVVSFYGVFLCGIMLGYLRSKRRERRRTNVFTHLIHEEEQREWGAWPRKHSIPPPPFPGYGAQAQQQRHVVALPSLPEPYHHLQHLHHLHQPQQGALSPLACALCAEQSSVSSLCSSADAHFAIEEESDSAATEDSAEENRGHS